MHKHQDQICAQFFNVYSWLWENAVHVCRLPIVVSFCDYYVLFQLFECNNALGDKSKHKIHLLLQPLYTMIPNIVGSERTMHNTIIIILINKS